MLVNIFEEFSFEDFIKTNAVKDLPQEQQIKYYNQYLQDLDIARQNWLSYQNKGPLPTLEPNGPVSCQAGMDVIFLIDYTGSMGNIINSIKSKLPQIVQTIVTESGNDYRLGLVLFDEFEVNVGHPIYTTKPLYTNLPADRRLQLPGVGDGTNDPIIMYITGLVELANQNENDFNTVIQQLNDSAGNFPIVQGSGTPEPGDVGYEEVLNGIVGTFRNNVAKIVILISDALPGGGNETYDQTTINSLTTSATTSKSEGIQVFYLDVNAAGVTRNPNEGYRILSDNTDGIYSQSTIADATSIITGIQNICTDNA